MFTNNAIQMCVGLIVGLLFVTGLGTSVCRPQIAEEFSGQLMGELTSGIFYSIHKSDQAGPTVMIVAGSRSTRPHLLIPTQQMRHWSISSGTLIVLSLDASSLANQRIVFSPTARNTAGGPAQAIWQFLEKHRPDWLVELDEDDLYVQKKQDARGGSLFHNSPAGSSAAVGMANAVNDAIEVDENKFTPRASPAEVDTLSSVATELLKTKTIVTVSSLNQNIRTAGASHRQKGKFFPVRIVTRVRHHRMMVHGLLRQLGVIDNQVDAHQLVAASMAASSAQERPLYLAAFDGYGVGIPRPFLEWLKNYPFIELHPIGSLEIKAGGLKNFDVIVFPGGEAMEQWPALGESGRLTIRQFIRSGGGYVGICAGAYMTAQYPKYRWGLSLLDADILDHDNYARGSGFVKIELTEAGRAITGEKSRGPLELHYGNGPLFQPAGKSTVADYEILAYYRTAMSRGAAKPETMIDTPAIIGGEYGKGRVLASSGHSGWSKGLEDFFPRFVLWAAKRDAVQAKPSQAETPPASEK